MSILDLERDGAEHIPGGGVSALAAMEDALVGMDSGRPGVRLAGRPGLAALLAEPGPIGSLAAARLGPAARPVRAILFDKRADANWALGWHQDRTIAVAARRDVPGFGPWTVKQGFTHVAPPIGLLERMLTMRVHIDPVPADNAPLLVAPGSHKFGLIAEPEIDRTVRRCGIATCLAQRGDIWLYATPILHASAAAASPAQRRVLQIDYAAEDLPGSLEWLGV